MRIQTRRSIDRACERGLRMELRAPRFCVVCSANCASQSVLALLEEHPLVLPAAPSEASKVLHLCLSRTDFIIICDPRSASYIVMRSTAAVVRPG